MDLGFFLEGLIDQLVAVVVIAWLGMRVERSLRRVEMDVGVLVRFLAGVVGRGGHGDED